MVSAFQLVIFIAFCVNFTIAGNFLIKFMLEKKPKSALNIYVYVLLISSIVWSLGMGLMSLQENDTTAYCFRSFGILGTFVFMAGVQFSLSHLSELSIKLTRIFNCLSLLGIPIFFAYIQPGQTIFVHTSIGTTFYFKPGPVTVIYSLYFFIVSVNILFVTIHTAKHSSYKRNSMAAKRLMIVEFCIFVGAIFDMVVPSFGFAAFPGSAITHFWGVVIFWFALHEMFQSEITISNMSTYVYGSLGSPILIFNSKDSLEIINSAASSFFKIDEASFVPGTISISELFDVDKDIFSFAENSCTKKAICKSNNANCEISLNKIKDSYEDTIGFICLINDLTEHDFVIQRLEQAKIAADEANLSKSLFLANMSHEIRTPMNAILGFSEIALSETTDEKSKEYFNEIKHAGNILLTVINDILNISKIELGKNEIKQNPYRFSKLIKDVKLITRANANKKGLALNIIVDEYLPDNLYGDSNKIREILLNLLGNSVKYTNAGGIEFKASFITDGDDVQIRFEIADTGIGIKQEDLPTIFDKFSRVDSKLTSTTEGTGLGLAITKGLVEMLGGTIEVTSDYGVGTRFSVIIPQKMLKENLPEASLESDSEEGISFTASLTGYRFLVVDDTKVNLTVASKFLEKYGATVDTCLSGAESIEKCKAEKYDIIFMDHMMPEMDGVEAMKKIRLIPGYEKDSNSKIVALTANAVDNAKALLLSEGFDDFISKPLKKEIIDRSLSRILSIKIQ